jgi:hypothetical protein
MRRRILVEVRGQRSYEEEDTRNAHSLPSMRERERERKKGH